MDFKDVAVNQQLIWFKTKQSGGFLQYKQVPALVLRLGENSILIRGHVPGELGPKDRWVKAEALQKAKL